MNNNTEDTHGIFLFYKHKVIRWFPYVSIDQGKELIKANVDAGNFNMIPDTEYLTEEMKNNPDDVHVFVSEIPKHE